MEPLLALLVVIVVWLVWHWRAAVRKYQRAIEDNARLEDRLERQQVEIRGPDIAGMLGLVSTDALLVADSQRQIQHLNPAARALFEVPDTVGSGDSVIAITRHHELDDLIREGLEDSEPMVEQIDIRGQPYRAHVIRTGPVDQPYLAIALEDVGELQRLGRARRDMVANISHELRTPITSIRLLVDTLLRGSHDTPDAIEKSLHKIGAQADILHSLAQELLDLSMIETGQIAFRMQPTALIGLVEAVKADLAEIRRDKGVSFEQSIDAGCRVLVDEAQMERAIRNLLHNAIKFSPEGGTVWIEARVEGERVDLLITDDGPGVHPDEHERIFERFYQSDTSRHGGGTGLGLAIVKHIVQAHGGEVGVGDVMDEAGRHGLKGAQIIVSLPVANGS